MINNIFQKIHVHKLESRTLNLCILHFIIRSKPERTRFADVKCKRSEHFLLGKSRGSQLKDKSCVMWSNSYKVGKAGKKTCLCGQYNRCGEDKENKKVREARMKSLGKGRSQKLSKSLSSDESYFQQSKYL